MTIRFFLRCGFERSRYLGSGHLCTWVNLPFSCTKGYSGQVKRHSLPFQVEAALKYLVVPLTFAHDCTSIYYMLHVGSLARRLVFGGL